MLKRLTVTSLLIMFTSGAQALTLGQIHVHSFINQPLKATIDLQGVKAGELKALKIKLASRSAFKKAGVDWNEPLESLKFSIIQSNKGPVIRVTSRQTMLEPFLSFVVDAKWTNGKMTKDFTLLLDPPLYSGMEATPVDVADAASVTARQPAQSDNVKSQQGGKTATSPGSGRKGPAAKRVTGKNLWQVASKVRPAEASMQQTMVAIHEENPKSFIRGNMNLLKKGQLLRIPSDEVIQNIPGKAAVKRVAQHEKAMRAGKSVASSKRLSPEIVALADEPAETPALQQGAAAGQSTGAESVGRLRLDSAADAVKDGALGGDLASGKAGLSTDAAGGDVNRALRSRVALLEEQLRAAHKLIRMKGELAQLQQLYRQINDKKAEVDPDQETLTDAELLLLTESGPDQESLSASDDTGVQEAAVKSSDLEQQPPDTTVVDAEPAAVADKAAAESSTDADQALADAPEAASDDAAAEKDIAAGTDEDVVASRDDAEQPSAGVADEESVAAETDEDVAATRGDAVQPSADAADEEHAAAEESIAEPGEDVVASRDDTEQPSAAAAGEEHAAAIDAVPEADAVSSTEKAEDGQPPGRVSSALLADANIGEGAAPSTPDREQAASPAVRRDSLIAGIGDNLLLGAGGVGIVGLMLFLLLGRLGRKESLVGDPGFKDEALVGESPGLTSLEDESSEVEHETESVTHSSAADEISAEQTTQESTIETESPGAVSTDEPQALDPLELAAVLIRNKETRQARDVLMLAIEEDPGRADLHIRLMELLHADKDRRAFEENMNLMDQSGLGIDSLQWQKIERMHGDLLPAGVESLGIVNQKFSEPETIGLDTGTEESDAGRIGEEDVSGSDEHEESDLEAALRAFEMELDDNRSEELISEAGLALDETAQILDSPVTSAIPDARIVEDLELAEDFVIDESPDTGREAEVISLDDSFGIDSRISRDFDDVFTKSTVQPGQQGDAPSSIEEQGLPDAGELSVTSFDTESSALKQAEAEAKIDLAAAFADLGDMDGARDILDEVISEGTVQQQRAAREMMNKYL